MFCRYDSAQMRNSKRSLTDSMASSELNWCWWDCVVSVETAIVGWASKHSQGSNGGDGKYLNMTHLYPRMSYRYGYAQDSLTLVCRRWFGFTYTLDMPTGFCESVHWSSTLRRAVEGLSHTSDGWPKACLKTVSILLTTYHLLIRSLWSCCSSTHITYSHIWMLVTFPHL